jgi:hypothetical protein
MCCISRIIIFCLLHYYLYKSRELHLESICMVCIICYFLVCILARLCLHQEELNKRENQLYACIPDSFLLYVVVCDDRSDEPKHGGENYMYCKLYKFSPSAFCCICVSKMYHVCPIHYLNRWGYIFNDRKNKHV